MTSPNPFANFVMVGERTNVTGSAKFRKPLVALACALGAAGCADRSGLWHNGAACAAAAVQTCSESSQQADAGAPFPLCDVRVDEPADAFAEFLRSQAPEGTPLDVAFEGLRAHGFRCSTGEMTYPAPRTFHGCRKEVLAGPLVTRNWIASIDVDSQNRVVGFGTNCAMTGQ